MAYEAIKNLSKNTTSSSTKKSTKSTTSDDDDLFRRVAAYARAKDQGSTVEKTDAPTVESRVEMPQTESSIRTYHPITPTKAQGNYNYGNVYASRFQPDETEEEEDNGYRDATLKDLTINSLKQGYYNALYGSESFKAMMGSENEKQKYEDILAGEDYQFNTDNLLEKGISGGANMIGQWVRQWTDPRSIAAGTAAATAAGIAGQAGPQVLVPEEVVTVPGAFMLGMQAGSAASNFEIEAGLAYNEMIDNGISEDTAKKIAMCVGGVNAALEFVQGDEIVKSLKILNKNPATKEAANTLGKRLVDMGIDVTKSVGSETLQEVAQEGSTIAGTQIGSKIDTGDWAYNSDEVLNRLGETAASSALSFGLLNVPGAALRGNSIISENNTKNKIGSKYNADINALVEEGLQSDQNSDSYRIASRLKEKLDSGETVSNSEAYDLAVANQKAINLEERNKAPAAASPSVTSVTASAETAAPAAQSRLQSIQSRLVESGMDAERASSTAQSISRILGGDTSVTGSDKDVLRVGNTAARTIFEEESGVKLPASNASTRKTVADYIAQTALSQQKQNTASAPKAQSAENVMESWQKQKAQEETVSQLKSKAMDNASAVASPETTLRQAAEYASRRVKAKNDIVIQNAVSTVGTNGNAVYQKYLGGAKNISSYTRAFERYYDAGQIGYPLERIDSAYSEGVDPKMLVEAYRGGQRDAFVPSEGKRTAQNQKATKRVKTRNKGKGRFYDNRTTSGKSISEKDATALKQMAKVFNVDIEVVDTIADDSGRSIANGYYDAAAGKIVIAADSDNPMMTVAKHEITHYLQRVNPQKYQEYKDYVMRAFYGNSQEAMNAEIQRRIDLAHMANQNLTRNQAMDEIVADATEKFLTDRESIDALVRENRSLAETILNAIRDVLRKMEAAMRGEKIGAKSDFLDIEQLKTAEKMWVDALTSAAMEDNVGIRYDGSTESFAPVWSLKTWNESEYVKQRKEAAKEIAEAIGISQKKALDYINSVNSIAKMIAEDRGRLDYESSPGRSSFVGNVEYGGSFDFSTLCKKRRLLTGTFSEIQNALPNTALTADEILEIRNMMADAGLEVSCGLCYVEGSRASMGEFTKEFIRLYRKYNPDAWYPDLATMNTPDGIEWVRINHPEVYSEYEKFWNNHGKLRDSDPNLFASQQKPKLYQMRTEYKNEVLKNFKKDSTVSKKNENGGIRLQSFSDFEVVHLLDTMQIIMDMSRVGLAGQAYTKVPDFAWALGDTGLKINLSLIAKDVDENGKLIFDDREGMPIADAMKLRDRYSKNVGTIIVTFTDDQLKAAMADPRIDFIIPFHRSQWKKRQYGAMGLPANTKDYTYQQNEKLIKKTYHEYRGRMVPDKATNYMPNTYWDFGKSGKENAENYLKMCAANNKRPKFYKFLKNNGDGSYSLQPDGSTDGYWKLLINFKMYDNDGVGSPQMPVKPDFNMEECRRMLNEYEGGHEKFPVAQGIVDQFVSKYKEEHKGVQFSLKDSTGRNLTKEQADFFKYSKVRDENGSLMVVYHGTPRGGFNEFSKSSIGTTSDYGYLGRGFYFTTKERVAKYYAGYLNSSEVKTGYVNITNPYIIPSKHDLAFTLESIMGHRYDGDNSDYERSVAFTNWLKDNGYDGVICGDEIMALRSNQFKNKDNTNPTSDPDIRYSFKEFSEAEKEAVKRFGTTTDFAEAGFILPTGEMLRFTDDAHKGERAYDHRAIGIVYGVDVDLGVNHGFNFESGKFLDEFVENGGIRFDAGDPGLDMDVGLQLSSTVPLTRAQEQLIRDLVSWKKEREIQFEAKPEEEKWMYGGPLAIRIDFGGDAEYAVGSSNAKDLAAWGKKSLEYDGGNINADRIINDIRHYYRTGEVKQPSAVAQFRYQLKTPDEMVSVTNQIMDEERRAKTVTDAEIMSQAVKDIAKTDAEKKAVSDYQRAMKRLAEYEKELAVYDATKAEHSKGRSIYTDASGKVKKSGVKYSAAEKAELQRKADWWKNRLREIEQREAFQKVLKREKSKIAQKHADEILKLKELYRVRMEKLRGQRDEAVDKARKAGSQKLKDYKQFQRDSKEYKALKDKLQEDVQWLSERLVSPSDAKHIPEELRKGVAAFLESLDFETKYTDSYEVRNGKPSDRIIKLRELHDAYQKILQDQSSTMELDQTQLDALNNLQAICENKRLADLSYEELGLVRDAIQYIRMTVNAANKTFNQSIKESISDLGEALIEEQRKKRTRKNRIGVLGEGDKLVNFDNVSPADKFHEYGGVMEKLYGEIRKGFDRHIENVKTAIDYTQNLTAGHEADIKEWSGKKAKAKQFKISDGTTIELTTAQVMSLYELMKRDQAVGHVLGSGIIPSSVVVTESKKYGKVKIDTAKQISAEKASRCTLEDIQKIVDTLTDDQKKIADGISKLFTTKCADWGNETSMRLYGYKKFKEKNYFPIKSSDAYLNARFDDSGDALIKNLGFTKNTVVNANNPIVVEDIFDVLADHVNKMSMYNALVVPLTDFNRVFNYKSRNADGTISDSVQMALEASGGKLGVSYVKQFMKDVNKQASAPAAESFINSSVSKYKKARIAASLRVLVQQPTSITRSADMIDPKYIVKGLAQKANYEEMFQNSPIAYWKSLGFYQTDMARNMKDILLDNESLMDRYTMGVYGKADDFSWGHLWNAVKLEQADLHPDVDKTSSEFMDLVSNRFEEVVDRTQVVDSVFHRSQIMRAPGAAAKMATAFMSEPTKAFNLLRTDLIDSVNSKDYSKVGRSVAVYIANAIFVSAAAGLVDAYRDDDDEDKEGNKRTLSDKYIENTLENVKDNINPLNMIPYLKEISSLYKGYSVDRMEMAAVAEVVNSIKKWSSGKYSMPYLIKDTALSLAEFAGYPAKNVERELVSLLGAAGDLIGGQYYREYQISKAKYNIANSQNRSVFYKHYTEALLAGDDAAAELILQDMVVNGIPYDNIISRGYQAEKTVVFKEARNLISDGNTTDAKKLVRDLAKKYGKKYSTLWKSVKEGASAEEPEETYDFNDLKDAVRKGQDTEEIEDYLTEYGGYSEEAMDEAIRMLTEKYR